MSETEFKPDWTLGPIDRMQVDLSLALTKHVPWWPGATDEQLEAVAREVIKGQENRLAARIEELEKALTAADDMHAQVCEEVERLMDAKPGSAREAALELWSAIAGKYDEARWGKEFSEARSTLEASDRNGGTE